MKVHLRFKTDTKKYGGKTIYNVDSIAQAIKIFEKRLPMPYAMDVITIIAARMYKDKLQGRRFGHHGDLQPK